MRLKIYYSCDQTYNSARMGSTRATSFGYGNKFDFTKSLTNAPEPNKYQMLSQFDKNKTKSKGSSFGLGRELMRESSYIQHSIL